MENDLRIQVLRAEMEIERMRIKPKDYMESAFFDALKERNLPFVLNESQIINMYEGWQMAKRYYTKPKLK